MTIIDYVTPDNWQNFDMSLYIAQVIDERVLLKARIAQLEKELLPVKPELLLADDGIPFFYQDDNGMWWGMCACGHRVGGSIRPGDKVALCVNCRFMGMYGGKELHIKYPEFLPMEGLLEQDGDHPDHIGERAVRAYLKEKADRTKARRLERKEERRIK